MHRNHSPVSWRTALFFCATLSFLAANTAHAAFIGSAVSINFFAGTGMGRFDVPIPSDADPLNWELGGPVEIVSQSDPSQVLARIDSLSLELDGDPAVSLNFSITANATDTNIVITSSTVSFAPIINSSVFATAAITVTDFNGNGASALGLFPGDKAYQARYNGSTVFANLVSDVLAPGNASNTGSERFPGSGTVLIGPAVSSIKSQFAFTLSANDSASGTSRFNVAPGQIIPEPSSFVLAALGFCGYLWVRFRRRS